MKAIKGIMYEMITHKSKVLHDYIFSMKENDSYH